MSPNTSVKAAWSVAPAPLAEAVAATMKVLANPERLWILSLLTEGERNVTELAQALDLREEAVHRHLKALQRAGLVGRREGGATTEIARYGLNAEEAKKLPVSYLALLEGAEGFPRREEQEVAFNRPLAPSERIGYRELYGPPPEACQVCQNSSYVRGLLEVANKMLEEAQRSQSQLRHLSFQVLTAHEEERKRIACELHDETAQALTSLLVRLRLLERAKSVDEAKTAAAALRGLTAGALEGVRRMAHDLRPSALDDLGLVAALQSYGREYSERQPAKTSLRVSGVTGRLPSEVELALYRVAQEALTNVAKHSGAKKASVVLQQQKERVKLVIEDDGRGFDVDRALRSRERGLGLFGMQERMTLVGGDLSVQSRPGKGTRVVAELTLRHPPPPVGG